MAKKKKTTKKSAKKTTKKPEVVPEEAKVNYPKRWLCLRLLSQRKKLSPWKSPKSRSAEARYKTTNTACVSLSESAICVSLSES